MGGGGGDRGGKCAERGQVLVKYGIWRPRVSAARESDAESEKGDSVGGIFKASRTQDAVSLGASPS